MSTSPRPDPVVSVRDVELSFAGVKALSAVSFNDYEGMLPPEAGATKGKPSEVAFRSSVISKVDASAPSGVSIEQDPTTGPTAEAYDFSKPCFSLQ
jgi:hypothetical protein